MTTTFPPKPWEEGATFTNDTTGVGYTYTGGKWLASGGPKVEGEFVSKKGGDEMEGPLKVTNQDGLDSRAGRRIEALGLFSGSESSALRLGTNGDRVYIGSNDTSFNGLVKLDELGQKGSDGIKINSETSVNNLLDIKADKVEYRVNRTSFDQVSPTEVVNASILDNLMRKPGDGYLASYLPLAGGQLTGQLTIKKNTQVALDIVGDNNISQIKFWSSGAVALHNYTAFKDNELVTKKYTDDAIKTAVENIDTPDVGFTPGQQVAKLNGTYGVEVGGFYILNGNVYCKVS